MNIEEKILNYAHLSPDAQASVVNYVEDHPEWATLLQHVRHLELMTDRMRAARNPSSDEALALYVLSERVSDDRIPTTLKPVFDALEEELDQNPDVRQRYEAAQERFAEVNDAIDPVEQFESLTGYSISAPANSDRSDEEASTPNDDSSTSGTDTDDSPPPHLEGGVPTAREPRAASEENRSPTRIYSLSRASRWAVAALLVLGVGYGVLFGVSETTQSPLMALSEMKVDSDVIRSYSLRTRGDNTGLEEQSPDALYLEALPLLQSARHTTLGLFPRYDSESLTEAESLLQNVARRTETGSFLWGESLFYLGKVHLAQEDVNAARDALHLVAQSDTRRSDEAYTILVRLEEVRPSAPR